MLGLPVAVALMVDQTAPPRGLSDMPPVAVTRGDVEGEFVVDRVFDGDTIEVRDEAGVVYRVRYIGIDTPEMEYETNTPECLAAVAKERNAALVLGKRVTLVRDVSETDTYGRLLRYVEQGGVDVGGRLIEEGYAKTLTIPPDVARAEVYQEGLVAARELALGLWGSTCLP